MHVEKGFASAKGRPLYLLQGLECHATGAGSRLSLGLGNTSHDMCVLLTMSLHIKDTDTRCKGAQTVVLLPRQALELVFTVGVSVADKDTAVLEITKETWCPTASADALSQLCALLLAQGNSADRDFAIEA